MLQNRLFFALASRSGFGATISDAVARSSIVLCNSVSADRIVMAASRLLHAVAACVILLSFAAGSRKSYWSGCMKAATVICQQIFSILALVLFLLHVGLEQCEVWGVKSAVWSVKEAVGSEKCEVWSVKFKFGVRSAQCEVWSVRFGVWRKQWEVRSVKCGLWSAKC